MVSRAQAIGILVFVTVVTLAALYIWYQYQAANDPKVQPQITLTATPSTVEYGAGAIISWQTTNTLTMNVTDIGDVSALLPNGSWLVYPGLSGNSLQPSVDTYIASGTSATESGTQSVMITVNPLPVAPQFLQLIAGSDRTAPQSYLIPLNQSIQVYIDSLSQTLNLSWNVAYCTYMELTYNIGTTTKSTRVSVPFGTAVIPLENLVLSSVAFSFRNHVGELSVLQLLVVFTY